MKPAIAQRLINLEAKIDTHLFGVYKDPVTGKYLREDGTEAGAGDFKTLKGAAVAAGAVGGGAALAKGGLALTKRYGADQIAKPADALQAVATGVKRDVAGAATSAGNFVKGKADVAGKAFRTGMTRDGGKFAKKSVLRGVRGAISAVTGGRVRLESKVRDRAINLAAKIDDAITA
jgi:hypothetical protein